MHSRNASGKGFYMYMVATVSAQLFYLVVYGCCFLMALMKFANLQQVNNPNSQDNFQTCCTNYNF